MWLLRMVALVVHVLALALWLGGVVVAGLSAAIIFPTMKGLGPRLPAYAAYEGDHWMLAAGKVAARIFHATDVVQGVCAGLALASAAILLGARSVRVRAAAVVWLAGLAGGVVVLGASLLWLRPRMDATLRTLWDAALAGDNAVAESARRAFGADHPLASNLMAGTAVLVLVALASVIPAVLGRMAAGARQSGGVSEADAGDRGR